MLSEAGYTKPQRCRVTGDNEQKIRMVTFDRDYVIKYFELRLIKPLFHLGSETIAEIVSEAFKSYANPSAYEATKTTSKNKTS